MTLKIITAMLGLIAIAIALDAISGIYGIWGLELANGQTLNLNYLLSEKPEQMHLLDSIAK